MRIKITKSFKGMDSGELRVFTIGDTCDVGDQELLDVIFAEKWGDKECVSEGECKDLADLTLAELKNIADGMDIEYKDNIKKAVIIKLISSTD